MGLTIFLVSIFVGTVVSGQGSKTPSWLEQRLSIGSFPIEVKDGALAAGNPQITLELPNYKEKKFGELTARIKGAFVRDGQIQFRGFPDRILRGRAKKRHKKSTFFIDYDEPVFDKLAGAISSRHGRKPTMEQLRLFVAQFISKKNLKRSMDIASRVAQTGEGDCTEHAVLLAALARKYKYPARIVNGLVITEIHGKFSAMGHAWVEIWQRGNWHLSDAALQAPVNGKTSVAVHGYLPVYVLEDEGPGSGAAIVSGGLNIMHIKRIIVE